MTLQNTGGTQLTVSADGSFTFAGTVSAGSSYDVSVATQPELQMCTVTNGTGTASANVTNIAISCADTVAPPTLSLSVPTIRTLRFSWTAVPGIKRYKLFEDPTGESQVFTQVGADIDASTTSLDRIVPLHLRVNASYFVQACAETRCIASDEVTASGPLIEAVRYFKAERPQPDDQFGFAVALSGDGRTLAIGAPFEVDENGVVPEAGAVYVFVSSDGSSWELDTRLEAFSPQTREHFGHAVALNSAGSILAVGGPDRDGSAGTVANTGAAYVFERSNGAWQQPHVLEIANATPDDSFGSSVALSDDGRLAVGAPLENSPAGADSGAVYVFRREQVLVVVRWFREAHIEALNLDGGDEFGTSVALSSDGATLAAGAHFEDSGATGVNRVPDEFAPDSGAVYVFTRDGQWTQQAYIKASNTNRDDTFGDAVALSGDGATLAVGATGEDSAATGIDGNELDDSLPQAGAAYVFARTGDEWEQQAYVKASNTSVVAGSFGDRFGGSLALAVDGSILAVGAPLEDSDTSGVGVGGSQDNSAAQAGAVYVFQRSNAAWAQRSFVKQSNTSTQHPRGLFGGAVSLSDDGATLAAGARSESGSDDDPSEQNGNVFTDAGAVYLY